MARALIPKREIAIRCTGNVHRIIVGPVAQILFCLAAFFLLLWFTFATAVTLNRGIANTGQYAQPEVNAHLLGTGVPDTSIQLLAANELLARQVAAALELADIAHDEQIAIQFAKTQLGESVSSTATRSELLAIRSEKDQISHIERLLVALEVATNDLTSVRQELQVQKQEAIALQAANQISRDKTRRAITRMTEGISLAADGLDSLFSRLGVDWQQLEDDIELSYSGAGGMSIDAESYLDQFEQNSDSSEHFADADIDVAMAAIDRLNVGKLALRALPIGHPVRRPSRFTDGYGVRTHPVHKRRDFHAGVDFAAPTGTPIHATGDGVVVFAGRKGAYGKTIVIQHAGGVETLYGHLSKLNVSRNERVLRNQHIGDMGSTGVSTGSHLHYEVRVAGQTVNPMHFIKAE